MPLNIPGILAPFQLLIYPRLVIPTLVVKGTIYLVLLEIFDQVCIGRHSPTRLSSITEGWL
jgi:hypothetical protein